MEKILIIDDDVDMCFLLEKLLTRKSYQVIQKHTGEMALEYLKYATPDLIICDLRLDDMDGISILKKVKKKNAAIPFIIITAYDDIQMSLNAIKLGALEYITKPILPEDILSIIQNTFKKNKTNKGLIISGQSLNVMNQYFSCNTEYLKKINTQISLVAPTNYNIVLCGESGIGKKALAYEIHKRSKRSSMPFMVITHEDLCGAHNETHAGIEENRFRFFEKANGGTIFFHNIKELPTNILNDLLSIIKTKTIKKSELLKKIELDVRIIISSTDFLWIAMLAGKIHENLFYHLNDFSIELLPLRSRKDDILHFANHFLQKANEKMQRKMRGFTPEVETIFKNYTWPGNLRELEKIINKAVMLTNDNVVGINELPIELNKKSKPLSVVY